MANDSYAAQVAQQRSQAASMEDNQDDFANSSRRNYDLSASGQPTGSYPSYQGGVAPKRDFGYEEYLNHVLGTTHFNPGGIAIDGPYAGSHQNDLIEKARDAYANMAPEDRAPWEKRVHSQDVRSEGDNATQGFEYDDQRDTWGSKGQRLDPSTGQPRTMSMLPKIPQPNFQPEAPATYTPSGPSRIGNVSMNTGGPVQQSNVIPHPAMTAPTVPSPVAGGQINGQDPAQVIRGLRTANAASDQAMGRQLVPVVGSGTGAVPSDNTAQYGPRITPQSLQQPSYRNGVAQVTQPMQQNQQQPTFRPPVAPAPALVSAGR
jgi:hypothetical protein